MKVRHRLSLAFGVCGVDTTTSFFCLCEWRGNQQSVEGGKNAIKKPYMYHFSSSLSTSNMASPDPF